jgi:Zn-dependent M28 family amino/carboxypeptidase
MTDQNLRAPADRLRQHVLTLAAEPRPAGSQAHRDAGAYVADHLQEAGFAVQEVRFREAGVFGANLLTQPLPEDTNLPLTIIAAHYDSKPGTPGADDNASAVAALLELAKFIRPLLGSGGPFPSRLQLASYDLEEAGLLGSYVHSRQLRKTGTAVHGMISLEMLAYTDQRPGSQRLPPHLAHLYPHVGNFIGVCGNEASRDLLQAVTAALKTVPELPVEFIAVPGNGEVLPEVRLSDHSSFWDHGYPALMVTDTSFFRNPHYHQPSDTPDTLDYPFLARVTLGVCEAARRLVCPTVNG